MSRKNNWCFTLNNYTEEDYISITGKECKYMVVGKETGESGTPHLQGFISFLDGKTLSYMKKHIHSGAHFEMANGSPQENYNYCSKEGDFIEIGVRPMSQKEKGNKGKEAIQQRWELAKQGKFDELPPEQIKIYEYIHQKYSKSVDINQLKNYWIYGKSGCGKSSVVRKRFSTFYTKSMSKWWDGYNGEDVVVLDDIDPNHQCLSYYLKIWCDHYVFNAEVKGGMFKIRPKIFIITSQYSPEEVFQDEKTLEAINRRFCVKELKDNISNNINAEIFPQEVQESIQKANDEAIESFS